MHPSPAAPLSPAMDELQQEVLTLREYSNVVTQQNEQLMAQVSNLEHAIADVMAERDEWKAIAWRLGDQEPTPPYRREK